ncbi:AraC family ligand binding domain-containing protein [Gallibacter sp. Marseille-QA0791]|uniref:AraC family ligand binding domain-containing protein n=1 Tax=Gallibacter sp. Marseille-QA0791 TaxID=3378781 RepID=UPI003D0BF174
MISQDYYMKSKLLVRPDFGERYSDVVIRNTVCREHPIHMHDCMEIVFVFRGALECNVSFERYVLREGDFIVVNSYDLYQLKAITEGGGHLVHTYKSGTLPSGGGLHHMVGRYIETQQGELR